MRDMSQTIYIEVQANPVNTFATNSFSGYDTTSGYYISYIAATGSEGGGYTGTGWYLGTSGNPFQGYTIGGEQVSSDQQIVELYNAKGGNLNDVFSTWLDRVDERSVSSFCNNLMLNDTAYNAGCITMIDE